ncbi:hypothetical protein GF382_01960, partial [Candidatus Falkowbacteria bacterium]|nr:hypothetical protein [Candidatus Falkowbacteria bacterium]
MPPFVLKSKLLKFVSLFFVALAFCAGFFVLDQLPSATAAADEQDPLFILSGAITDDQAREVYESGEPFTLPEPERKIKVAVILAETKDVSHISTPITAQPCKLIPEKTYQNGHDREYYEDLLYCVRDYHCENSFGKRNEQGECEDGLVDLEFDI